jgi:acyl-CoA synthetase (NDP forming)
MTASETLRPLFEPRSVAVVGVSRSGKQGAIFLMGLLDPGFQGKVYVVNPAASEIMGVRSYPSISALPERPDLAVLVLPAEPAIEVVRQCAEAGVPGAALFTAGFNEAGTAEGDARARELLDAAGGRTRLIGPNGMGIYNPALGIAMAPGMPSKVGGVGLVSQSGSLVQFLARAVNARGLGFSKAVSMGNQLDLDAADYLDYFADDPDTRVIGAYLEGVPDGRRFLQSLRRAAARKAVILWKVGRVSSGTRAALSHTGQLAGDNRIWQAVARQARVVLVREAEELVDTLVAASALEKYAVLGRRFAIVNGPGGPAVSASDACEEAGLCLAALSEGTTRRLGEIVAAAGTSLRNPVDIGMVIVDAARTYGRVLRVALADAGVDAALVIGGGFADRQAFSEMLVEASRQQGKPVLYALTGFFGEDSTIDYLADHGVVSAPSAERALRAYARLALR